MAAMSPERYETLRGLRERGFDKSSYDKKSHSWRVRCSQCEALVINGVACHETGCPNKGFHAQAYQGECDGWYDL